MLMKRDTRAHFPIDPFYSYVLAGAEQECQRQKLSLMYASVEVDERNRIAVWPPMLMAQQLMGLLVVGPFPQETIVQIVDQTGQPVILVDAYSTSQQCDSIVVDNLNAADSAITYLIEQGHRHIGFVGSAPDSYPSVLQRRDAYLRVLRRHNITETYIEDSPLTREAVYDATIRLLQRAPEITAIFACNDNVAIGAMDAAHDMGLKVPRDLSIIGFDNIDLAREVKPSLTTVDVDKKLMGVLAVRYLLDRLENPSHTPLTTLLRASLVIRKSVRSLIADDRQDQ